MKRVIAYSLWGKNPKYTVGALRNAESIGEFYPGWTGRFYCAQSVPDDVLSMLRSLGAEVVLMDQEGDWEGMFWRFYAVADPDVELMISRDTDSRLSRREAVAVEAWIESGRLFHVMRDHPAHNTEILGGMWGVRKPALSNIKSLIDSYAKGDFWQVDQNFLREIVWPIAKTSVLVHDPFFDRKPFPNRRRGMEFVGQVWDADDVPDSGHTEQLRIGLRKMPWFRFASLRGL